MGREMIITHWSSTPCLQSLYFYTTVERQFRHQKAVAIHDLEAQPIDG
jgi:hypothetical protein